MVVLLAQLLRAVVVVLCYLPVCRGGEEGSPLADRRALER